MTDNNCNHQWQETYTGFKCELCGLQVPEWFFDPPPPDEIDEEFYDWLPEDDHLIYDFGELGFWRFHE